MAHDEKPVFPEIAAMNNEEMAQLQQQLQSVRSHSAEIAEVTLQKLNAGEMAQRRRLFNAQSQAQSELMTTLTMTGVAFAGAALIGWFLFGRSTS